MEVLFSVGNIAIDKKESCRYRILSLLPQDIVLCQMDISKLKIIHVDNAMFISLVSNHSFEIVKEESRIVVDEWYMSDIDRKEAFDRKLNAIVAAVNVYEPFFYDLSSKKSKPEFDEIVLKSGIRKKTFWKYLREYLQSGMKKALF